MGCVIRIQIMDASRTNQLEAGATRPNGRRDRKLANNAKRQAEGLMPKERWTKAARALAASAASAASAAPAGARQRIGGTHCDYCSVATICEVDPNGEGAKYCERCWAEWDAAAVRDATAKLRKLRAEARDSASGARGESAKASLTA